MCNTKGLKNSSFLCPQTDSRTVLRGPGGGGGGADGYCGPVSPFSRQWWGAPPNCKVRMTACEACRRRSGEWMLWGQLCCNGGRLDKQPPLTSITESKSHITQSAGQRVHYTAPHQRSWNTYLAAPPLPVHSAPLTTCPRQSLSRDSLCLSPDQHLADSLESVLASGADRWVFFDWGPGLQGHHPGGISDGVLPGLLRVGESLVYVPRSRSYLVLGFVDRCRRLPKTFEQVLPGARGRQTPRIHVMTRMQPGGGGDSTALRTPTTPPPPRGLRPTVNCQRCRPQASMGAKGA